MKLLKYVFFIIILISCIVFIIQLDKLNTLESGPIMIKFPYLSSMKNFENGIQVWEAIILTLSIGVFIGFIIALFQLISQKSEILSLKSKIRRLTNELDNLRNQSLDDDIDIEDDMNSNLEV